METIFIAFVKTLKLVFVLRYSQKTNEWTFESGTDSPQSNKRTKLYADFYVEVLMLQKQAEIISHVADTDLSAGVWTSHRLIWVQLWFILHLSCIYKNTQTQNQDKCISDAVVYALIIQIIIDLI